MDSYWCFHGIISHSIVNKRELKSRATIAAAISPLKSKVISMKLEALIIMNPRPSFEDINWKRGGVPIKLPSEVRVRNCGKLSTTRRIGNFCFLWCRSLDADIPAPTAVSSHPPFPSTWESIQRWGDLIQTYQTMLGIQDPTHSW